MLTRHTLIDQFSAFIELTDHRFSRWLIDPQLKRSMSQVLSQVAQPVSTKDGGETHDANLSLEQEQFFKNYPQTHDLQSHVWTRYWHQQWQTRPNGRAYHHLMAFVQESCYWAAHKISMGFASTQYSLGDCFQVAIASFPKILKSFSPDQGAKLDTYARMAFSNIIRDTLRQRKETDICTDWSLLRKVSQKRLQEAIAAAGEANQLSVYTLAWQSFKALYVPQQARSTKQLEGPDDTTWEAIAQRFHEQFPQQEQWAQPKGTAVDLGIESIDATTLQQWLRQCAAMVRSYLYPQSKSLNAPKAGAESGELQDSLVYGSEDAQEQSQKDGLLGLMVAQEEHQQRQQQRATIQQVLIQAVDQLAPDAQHMLNLYYGEHQSQKDIAQVLNIKQYTVSRRLGKIRETLLKKCVAWSEDTLHISLTSDVLKTIGLVIDEWLCSHYATQPKEQR